MDRLIFACLAPPGAAERQAAMLSASIRAFAEALSASPIWVLVPGATGAMSGDARERLASLDVRLVRFGIDQGVSDLPFAAKVIASAAAEAAVQGQSDFLVWMDSDSLVVQEPSALLLSEARSLGCRPVDCALIGSLFERPVDPFWRLVYQECGVPEERVFPMTTSVDENRIRAYFNAGLLVVRPERGLLELWHDNLLRLWADADLERLCRHDRLYRIFFHQAALAGSVLSSVRPEEIEELPHRINYPLHLHARYPVERRLRYVNELITGRYDVFFDDPDWGKAFPAREPLKSWLDEQLDPSGPGYRRSPGSDAVRVF